jgi:hypothetical protein
MPALTAQAAAFACLEYIGEFSLTFVEYTGDAATGVRRALVRAMNEALEELFELNPQLFKREVGATVLAPVTGTVGVTQGDTAVTSPTFTGSPALHGNTILIAGQTEHNAISTEGSDYKLLFPYTGPTGTQPATLYGDVLLLDAAYSKPLSPVWLSNIRILDPLAGKADFLGYDPRQDLNSDWGRQPYGSSRFPRAPLVAQPEAYFAETHTALAGNLSQIRLALTPIPERQYSLRFDAGVRPLAVTDAHIGTSGDPNRYFPLPAGLDHKFLLPLILYYWSKTAFFKNEEAKQQIVRDRNDRLPEIEQWKVQPATGGYIDVGGWK